jgi:hypothetical protein
MIFPFVMIVAVSNYFWRLHMIFLQFLRFLAISNDFWQIDISGIGHPPALTSKDFWLFLMIFFNFE